VLSSDGCGVDPLCRVSERVDEHAKAHPLELSVVGHLVHVWIEQANGWGIEGFNVDKLRVYNARSRRNGNAGIKLGQTSRDWEIHGGRFWDNLLNGINTYASRWLIVGTRVDGNVGSGINIKAADGITTANTPNSQGMIVGPIVENNDLGLELFSGSSIDPLPNHITLVGGVYRNNVYSGVRVDGRNVSLLGVVSKNNGQHGIEVRDRSFDVTIVSPEVSANGQDGLGAWSGIRIDGDRVRVFGAQVNGVDEPASIGDPTGTSKHKYGIDVGSAASDVLIDGCVLRNSVTAPIGGTLTGTTIRDTVGWVAQNSGTATVSSGATEVTVNHGLSLTPSAEAISVTPTTSWGNVTGFWVDTITATTFKLKVSRTGGGATNVSFRWDADTMAP
jgi:hypothetical protein